MRFPAALLLLLAILPGVSSRAIAQDPPPRIGPFVIDARGAVPLFKKDPLLAESRGVAASELPGRGLGVDAGAHLYLFTWKAMTVGIGGQVTLARSHATPPVGSALRPVTERFTSISPQISFNFGNGNGWSYLSAGMGAATRSVVPDGAAPTAADQERLRTLNYGGGARWFAKPHVAFTVDFRFHQTDPGTPIFGRSGSPRTTFIVIGAGISVK